MIFGSNDLFRPRPTTPPAPADPSAGRDRPGDLPAEIGTATLVLTGPLRLVVPRNLRFSGVFTPIGQVSRLPGFDVMAESESDPAK